MPSGETVVPQRSRLGWYAARLRAMTPAEVAWRGASEVRARVAPVRRPPPVDRWDRTGLADVVNALRASRAEQLAADGARLAAGEVELWGTRYALGDVDWFLHPDGARWPAGDDWRRWELDPKPLWELHRHQHLLALACSGRAEDETAAAAAVEHWAGANPPGSGPGWASPYEAAHRLFAWPLLFAAAGGSSTAVASSYAAQRAFVEQRPSRYSSANNHRLAELVGLLAAALVYGDGDAWTRSFEELELQAQRQTFADGGNREQASGYTLYVLEILWGAVLLCCASGRPVGALRDVISRMTEWLTTVADLRGEPPPVGDDAEDRWLRLPYFEPRSAAALVHRALRALDGEPTLAVAPLEPTAHSCLLPESGYAILRRGDTRVVFDVGELGFGSLAAHGHADALSICADSGGEPALLDGGTGTYLSGPARYALRGTAAHNTVVVNGEDQAEQLGAHLWGARYTTRVEHANVQAGYVRAQHDGYVRRFGAVHTRAVWLVDDGTLVVIDRVVAPTPVTAALHWHMPVDGATPTVDAPGATAASDRVQRSDRYRSFEPACRHVWTLDARDAVFVSAISLGGGDADVSVERAHARVTVSCGGRTLVESWTGMPELR